MKPQQGSMQKEITDVIGESAGTILWTGGDDQVSYDFFFTKRQYREITFDHFLK
jgi:hypothetical protein